MGKPAIAVALPCIVCKRELDNIGGRNQPNHGLAFATVGHYGTCAFDPMDGTYLEINVCDPCLTAAGERGDVLHFAATVKPWSASVDTHPKGGDSEAAPALLSSAVGGTARRPTSTSIPIPNNQEQEPE